MQEEKPNFKEDNLKVDNDLSGKFPSREVLLNIIDKLKDLTEKEKENLKKGFDRRAMNAEAFQKMQQSKYFQITFHEYLVFYAMLFIILFVFCKHFAGSMLFCINVFLLNLIILFISNLGDFMILTKNVFPITTR